MNRALDLILGGAAVVVLSPLLVLTAVAVVLESGRPVLFKQERIGRGGRPFGMYKFRSMVKDAAQIGPYFTADNDPRITRVGRFIRKTSLDELPQLFNVLKGDMSLIGPRPDVAAQRDCYTEAQWLQRHSVRPGITGLAQVLYRSDAGQEQRTEADLRYVREANLWLDLRILWWTLGRLSGRGSN